MKTERYDSGSAEISDSMTSLISDVIAASSGFGNGDSTSGMSSSGTTCRPRGRMRASASLIAIRVSQVENAERCSNCRRCVYAFTYACCITSSASDSSRTIARTAR